MPNDAGGRRLAVVGLLAAALGGAALGAGLALDRTPGSPSNGILLVATTEDPIAVDPATGRRLSPFEPLMVGSIARATDMRGAADLTWAPDGQSIAYATAAEVHVLDLRTGEDRRLEVGDCGELGCNVAWSPDGSTIAVTVRLDLGSGEVHLVNPATGATTRVATMPGAPTSPSWSPDGTSLAFSIGPDLWTVRRDGNALLRVATEGALVVDAEWSPDGTRIGYLSFTERDDDGLMLLRIVTVAPDGSGRLTIADAGACHCLGWWPPGFTWSPDGTRMALVTLGYIPPHPAGDPAGPANGGLYVANVDGSGRELLVRDVSGSPSWRPLP